MLLKNKIRTKIGTVGKGDYRNEQKKCSKQLLESMFDEVRLRYEKSGRPFIDRASDISISHTKDIVAVSSIEKPYRVGIDIEQLTRNVSNAFCEGILTESEKVLIEKISPDLNLSQKETVVLFWSVKESFFKSADLSLVLKHVEIVSINDDKINLSLNMSIKKQMKVKQIKHIETFFKIKNKLCYVWTICKKNS